MTEYVDNLLLAVAALASVIAVLAWVGAWCATVLTSVGALRERTAPLEPRRPASWGLLDVLGAAALIHCAPLVGSEVEKILPRYFDVTEFASVAAAISGLATSLAVLFAFVLSIAFVSLRTGSTFRDLGFDLSHTIRDLWLGVSSFVLIGPVVFAIQMALTHWFPSEHPLLESVRAHPSFATLTNVAVAALLVAPLIEEFLFRVLLQGWMERVATIRGGMAALVMGEPAPPQRSEASTALDRDEPNTSVAEMPKKSAADDVPTSFFLRWLPIVCSAGVFALLHVGHGPDPIPLFVFALALGYLYQRTGRILPSLTLHFLLNGVSLVMLMIEVYGPRA
jgi:membrane protease YdiL (CAAX protease family)